MDGSRMTSGFYKYESDAVAYGPNYVLYKDFELRKESKDEHTYPVDGWYWFDTMEEAYLFFNIPLPEGEDE